MIRFDVSLTVEGPLLTKDSRASVHGVDAASLRRADGSFEISDTLIKGRLRDAWLDLDQQVGNADAAHQAVARRHVRIEREILLGLGADEGKRRQRDPHGRRGRLRFSDMVAPCGNAETRQIRVKLDDDRLAADDRMLLELEPAGAPGERVTFTGTIDADVPETEAENVRLAVEAGLRWITAVGGLTGVGYGAVLDAHVARAPDVTPRSGHATGIADTIEVALTADRPLCVMGHTPVHQNVFESLDYVPGNVLKGALAAAALRRAGIHGQLQLTEEVLTNNGTTDPSLLALARHLSAIRVRHALPGAAGGVRPRAVPLSIIKSQTDAGGPVTLDAALLGGPVLIGGRAPIFAPDWKGDSDVRARFGWADPQRSLRVRTAIERATRRALDEALFAHERVSLREGDAWRSVIDVAAVGDASERQLVVNVLRSLFAGGIGPVGKSKAFMQSVATPVSSSPGDSSLAEAESPSESGGKSFWVLVLQSEALLGSPDTYSREGALTMYREAFAALSGGVLTLARMFAQQQLCGGAWLHEKFRQPKRLPYSPYLLTRAGSVFVLQAATGETTRAQDAIGLWRRFGLPLESGALSFYGIDNSAPYWEQCPFLPENGYGEVAVNQGLHWEWHPEEQADLTLREVATL